MKSLDVFRNPVQKHRVVIVLQARQAYWFKWLGKELVDTFVETLRLDTLTKTVRCPWIQSDTDDEVRVVELILDSGLEELDRIQLDGPQHVMLQALRKQQLTRHLHSDHPEATVNHLPNYMLPDVLSIVHHILPESFRLWIEQLQNQHVHVGHVVTASELFCQCTKAHKGPVLVVHGARHDRRHLLIDKAVPLHMRVDESDLSLDSTQLECVGEDNITYILEVILKGQRAFDVMMPSLELSTSSSEFSAAQILTTLLVGCPVEASLHTIGHSRSEAGEFRNVEDDMIDGSDKCDSKPSLLCTGGEIHALSIGKPFTGERKLDRLQSWINNKYVKQALRKWRVDSGRRVASSVLHPSHVKTCLANRIASLQKATLLCAFMAMVTITVASVHGMNAARERVQLTAERVLLRNKMAPLEDSLSILHKSPAYASLSLQRIEQFGESQTVDPATVLAIIASAMTESPSLRLDSLSWRTLGEAGSGEVVFTIAQSINSREALWQPDDSRPQILLELSGSVVGKSGIREQQLEFESFLGHMKSVPGMETIKVLESPLNTARSSELLAGSRSAYRISLILTAG